MTDSALDALRVELQAARERGADFSPLDLAIRRYAASCRASGVTPERMVVGLAGLLNGPALAGLSDWWRAVLRARCVSEAIAAYYAIDLDKAKSD